MSSGSTESTSPFWRPRFIIAAVVVAVIVALAVVLAIVNGSGGEVAPSPPTSAAPTSNATGAPSPAATQPQATAKASVCGLAGEKLEGRLTTAPAVDEWRYQATTAFPISRKHGPGATDPAGFRYCFQHSPEGALFAAASAIAGSDNPAEWGEYFLSSAVENREALIGREPEEQDTTTRMSIVGFRLLEYSGTAATIDLAVRATANGKTAFLSAVYPLTWESGDWKFLPEDPAAPFSFVAIPDTAGYVPWGE